MWELISCPLSRPWRWRGGRPAPKPRPACGPDSPLFVYRSDHFELTSQTGLSDSNANTVAQAFEVTRQLVEALPWGIRCRPAPELGFYQARLFESRDAYIREGGLVGTAGDYIPKDRVFLLPWKASARTGAPAFPATRANPPPRSRMRSPIR